MDKINPLVSVYLLLVVSLLVVAVWSFIRCLIPLIHKGRPVRIVTPRQWFINYFTNFVKVAAIMMAVFLPFHSWIFANVDEVDVATFTLIFLVSVIPLSVAPYFRQTRRCGSTTMEDLVTLIGLALVLQSTADFFRHLIGA